MRIRCQFKIFKFYCLIKKFPLVKLFKKIVIFKCSVLVKNRKVFNGLSLQSTNRYFRRLQNREYLNKAVVKRLFLENSTSLLFSLGMNLKKRKAQRISQTKIIVHRRPHWTSTKWVSTCFMTGYTLVDTWSIVLNVLLPWGSF